MRPSPVFEETLADNVMQVAWAIASLGEEPAGGGVRVALDRLRNLRQAAQGQAGSAVEASLQELETGLWRLCAHNFELTGELIAQLCRACESLMQHLEEADEKRTA